MGIAALVLAVWLWSHSRSQEARIDALREDLVRVESYIPGLLRSELSAQEKRLMEKIDGRLDQIEALLAKR